MANHLKMAKVHAILTLHARGWSNRRIAQELGIDRDTVSRHVRREADRSNTAKAPTGSAASDRHGTADDAWGECPPSSHGAGGSTSSCASDCEAYRDLILAKL